MPAPSPPLSLSGRKHPAQSAAACRQALPHGINHIVIFLRRGANLLCYGTELHPHTYIVNYPLSSAQGFGSVRAAVELIAHKVIKCSAAYHLPGLCCHILTVLLRKINNLPSAYFAQR